MMLDTAGLLRLRRLISDGIARALKSGTGGRHDQALKELRELCSSALGMEYGVLSMLDPKSAVDLLLTHHQVLAFVLIVEAMGEVLRSKDPAGALKLHQQALHVAAALYERDGAKPELNEVMQRLFERIS